MFQKLGIIGFALYLMVSFQNCSKVNFDESSTLASSKGTSDVPPESVDPNNPPDDTIVDDEDDVIDDVISENAACDPIFNSGNFMDLKGQDHTFNGFTKEVLVANGNNVRANGMTEILSVNGAKTILANGLHQAVCLKGERFQLNGSSGLSGIPVVLIGSNDNAQIGSINGAVHSDLVLKNIKSIGSLNGLSFNTYIYGGSVDSINGGGFDLHLMKGTHVKKINGLFRNIYLYDGSTIGFLNGHHKLVRVKKP